MEMAPEPLTIQLSGDKFLADAKARQLNESTVCASDRELPATGLRELVLAETAAVARTHSDASEGQESDFGHRTSCLHSKHQLPSPCDCEFSWRSEDVNRTRYI
jgi:hypothetical protein